MEQAIESTGVTLCGNLNQGDVSYQIIQQSFGTTCTPDTADADVRIWDDASDPYAAEATLQTAKSLNAGPIWSDGLFVVEDESPPPGLSTALAELGFQNITG